MIKFKKVYIEITNSCNMNCSFCSKSNRSKRDMSLEEFEHVIKEIKNHTNYIYMHVKGEPLLHKNFIDFLKICDENGIKVNITTNGTLLNKNLEKIKDAKCIRQINISLQAHSSDSDIKDILNSVINLNEDRKDISIVFRFWALTDLSLENNQLLKKIIEFFLINEEISKKIKTEKNTKIRENLYINKAPLFEWPSINNAFVSEKGFCYGLKTHIGVLSDGTVVPCCFDGEGVINLGNIFITPLNQILESDRTKKIINSFRDNNLAEELCQKCSYRLLLKNK